MACCGKKQPEEKQQVLGWHGSHRIPNLALDDTSLLPAQDVMGAGIEQLTSQGIESLQKAAGPEAQLSFSLNVHREQFEDFSMLYVTVIGTWLGQLTDLTVIKGKQNGSTKEPKTQSAKTGPRREDTRRILEEPEFPPEVKFAADQLRGQLSSQKGGKEESGQGQQASSQQSFEVKSKEPAKEQKQPDTSVPPSSGHAGQGPSLSGVFDD